MPPSLCGFRHRPRPSDRDPPRPATNCGLSESVRKFLRPRSLWAAVKAKPKQFPGPENDQVVRKGPTLEDLIMSSPAPGFSRSSEYKQSSRRIHPSFDGGVGAEGLPESGEGKRKQLAEAERTGICRTKSGKEKKVTFRSPEVADVFVVEYPPEMGVMEKE